MSKEVVTVNVRLNPEIHKAFKVYCIDKNISMQEILSSVVERIVVKYNDSENKDK